VSVPLSAKINLTNRINYGNICNVRQYYDIVCSYLYNEVLKMDRWMTLKEVAEYLNVSKDSIYRLAQKREIPASKLGNLWRFRKEEIDDWMKNNRNNKRK
jgi:excisionase family DNA binding protein